MYRIRITTLCLLIATGFQVRAQSSYKLSGTAPTALNGYQLQLSYFTEGSQVFRDSTMISEGKFTFSGKLPFTATLASLYLARPQIGIHQFFLENRAITVSIHPTNKKNPLDSCTFQQAPIQQQYIAYKQYLKPIDEQITNQFKKMDTAMTKADEAERKQMTAELSSLFRQNQQHTVTFIKSHPDMYLSLYQLTHQIGGGKIDYPDSLQQLLQILSPSLQQTPEAVAFRQRITVVKAARIGQTATWTAIPTTNQQLLVLSNYKGRYVLIDFWASWCGPCIQNLPALKDLHKKYSAGNLDVVGISLDNDSAKWTAAIKKHELPWIQASDLKGWQNAVAVQYDIKEIPQYILVDPQGKIVANSNKLTDIEIELKKSFRENANNKP